jgi:hypothetical protein
MASERRCWISPPGVRCAISIWIQSESQAAPRLAFLAGAKVAVGIDNLFDRDPPHADAPVFQPQVGFDVFNADPIGRFITARLIKRW